MDLLNDFDFTDEQEPVQTSREARIHRALEWSKASYKTERVVVPPGWFSSLHNMSDIDLLAATSRKMHEIEWSIQQLYLQQRYDECLSRALKFLAAIQEFSTRDPNEPKQELRRRELLDIGMRCGMKLKRFEDAGALADQSRLSWRISPGLAATAAEVYLGARRPFDAITSILHAFASRGPLWPYLHCLRQAFCILEDDASHSDPKDERLQAARALREVVDSYAGRLVGAWRPALFGDEAADRRTEVHVPSLGTITETQVTGWCFALGIPDADTSRVVVWLCHQQDTQETEEPRSVRTL